MKTQYILLVLTLLLFSCADNNEKRDAIDTEKKSQNSNDSIALNQIIKLYKWYRDNPNIQNNLVNDGFGDNFDSTKFYSVNFKATDKYLSLLKNTNYFSDNYISLWQKYFEKCEVNFKENPSNDGPPDGFEYDFLTKSQDFEEEIKFVEKAKINEVKNINNSKILTVEFTTGNKLTFYLTQNNNTWLIDKIE